MGVVVEALVADKNTPARFDALPSPDDPRAKPKILEIRTMFKSAICLSELIERTANKVSQCIFKTLSLDNYPKSQLRLKTQGLLKDFFGEAERVRFRWITGQPVSLKLYDLESNPLTTLHY